MVRKIIALGLGLVAATLATMPAQARLAANKLAANRIAFNKLAANRIAFNRIAFNRIAGNRNRELVEGADCPTAR